MVRTACILSVLSLATAGCHGILDVTDPTLIRAQDIANVSGANAQRRNAITVLMQQIESIFSDVSYITDEWMTDVPVGTTVTNFDRIQLDLRNSAGIEATVDHQSMLERAFWQTSIAIPAIRAYTPDSLKGDFLGQMYGLRGYLLLQMAEDLCPGFPLNDVVDNQTAYGGPLTTDSAVALAGTFLDSAVKYAHDSTRIVTLARVVKGRALLDQGKYTEAAAMVAPVPTASSYAVERNYPFFMNPYYCDGCFNFALGEREGTNGQPFASANDPRVPAHVLGPRSTDLTDTLYYSSIYRDNDTRPNLASGIEARLIQAEAALHDGQSWKPTLDSLRATVGLDSLIDPGTTALRVDMIYRERAFWLFMTGRRLGDMRRLVKNYGRDPESVFPTGRWLGGTRDGYGTATSIPFNFANQHRYNPYITTGCTSR